MEFGDHYIRFVYRGGYVLEDPVPILGVSQANPGVVNVSGTPYANGDWVFVTGVLGMTELNGQTFEVTAAASGHLQFVSIWTGVTIDTSVFAGYLSGGTLQRIYTIASPYAAIDLPYLKFSQSADVMSLTCSNPQTLTEYPPYDLTRLSAIDWTLTPTSFASAIAAPTSVQATPNALPPSNGTPGSFLYVVTAVDKNGNESIASTPPALCNGVDLEVEGGTNTITWTGVTGAKFYNVYRSPCAVGVYGVKWGVVPPGSIMGFVGSSFGTSFADTQQAPDLTQTPPLHQEPFAPGQILAVDITGGGSGQTAVTYSITTVAGSGFAGVPLVSNGALGGFLISNGGKNYVAGDSIAFNGAGFASGSIHFSANPSAGDTITLNSVVWTFVSALTGPNQTLIAGALAATLAQLVTDLGGSGNASLTVAAYSVDITNAYLLIAYKTAGTGGNAYTLAASAATPSGGTLAGGSGSGSAPAAATGSLHFGGGNPTNTQTIILNGVTWTFVTSGATGNQTNLKGTLALTLAQLQTDLTASVVPAIAAATYAATATDLDVTYGTTGAIGNTYTLGAGTAGDTASGPTLTGGVDGSSVPTATLDVGPASGTYPGVNIYFQQRHFFANSLNNPDTFWASQTGLFDNMDVSIPTIATDAITATPWTEQVNGIQWLVPMPGGLIVMTGSRAWQLLGEGSYQLNSQPMTPATTQAQPQAFNGTSATIPPLVIDQDVLFVEALSNVVRDLAWNVWVNIYTGADLTILSSHLFLYRKIIQWAWARTPYKVVWSCCDDGTMLALTYLKEQEVYGWTRSDTEGLVVGMTGVTEPPVNATYAIVQRFTPDNGLPSSLVGVLTAEENYGPSLAAEIATGTQPEFCTPDQTYPGMTYDPVQRLIYYPLTQATAATLTNTTGFTLWSGYQRIQPGATYDATINFNFSTVTKSVATGAVTSHSAYGAGNVVPAGIGVGIIETGTITPGAGYTNGGHTGVQLTGGHGTGAVAELTVSGTAVVAVLVTTAGKGYQVGDVLSGTFPGGGSGFAFTLTGVSTGSDGTWRRYTQDSLAATRNSQGNGPSIVDSYTGNYWVQMESCEFYVFRKEDNFALTISPLLSTHSVSNVITPVGIASNWVYAKEIWDNSGDQTDLYLTPRLVTADEIAADQLLIYATFTYPSAVNTAWYKECFDFAGNFYVFGCQQTGAKDFRLYKFTPPTSAPYEGPTLGGGFTDITPWGAGSGPNADASGYTLRAAGEVWQTPNEHVMAYYLPATDDLVLLSEFYPTEHTAASLDPTLFFIDCTYVHAPGGGAPTFDQHSKFVTGYMTADWQTTTNASQAAYAISDFYSVDHFVTTHDFDYRPYGVSYTDRWFFFRCQNVTGGSLDPSQFATQDVLVLYRFAYGQPPEVLAMYAEDPWNNNPLYFTYDGNFVVAGSMNSQPNGPGLNLYLGNQDRGFYDSVAGAWWWSGQNANVTDLNPAFADRAGKDHLALPFLKVALYTEPNGSGAYFMERMDNRLWQSVEDAYAVDAGVSNPLISPAANLSASTLSGSTVFTADQSVFTSANAGDVVRMGGGIATVTGFLDVTHLQAQWNLAPSAGVTGFPFSASGTWTIATPVTVLHAPHLAGMEVVGLADGVPITLTVADDQIGTAPLPFPASNVKIGLPFMSQMQTPYLNGQQVVQGGRKVIPAATLRLAASGPCEYGTNQPDGGAQNPQQIGPLWSNLAPIDPLQPTGGQDPAPTYTSPGGQTVTQLWTGDLRVVGNGADWVSKGQVAVQQSLPLPLEVTAVEPEILDGDVPERGYGQDRGGGEERQGPRPPGMWMLRGRGGI